MWLLISMPMSVDVDAEVKVNVDVDVGVDMHRYLGCLNGIQSQFSYCLLV